MAEINVDNMEQNSELFKQKMGFPHDAEGLEMTDEQLVNFLLLCHQSQHGIGQNEEMESEDGSVKVKIMKVGGDMTEMMDEMLGNGGPKMTSY